MLHHLADPLAGLERALDRVAVGIVGAETAGHELEVAGDDEQRIVDLVGGRVGQLGDRAQGLGLALSDLGALALGDVLHRALVVQHAPAGRADGPGALARRDDASVVTTQLHLHVADHAVPLDRAPPALAILHTRVDVGRVHGQQGRAIRIAEHRDQRPVDVEDPSLGRRPVDADGHTLEQSPQPFFRVLGLAAAVLGLVVEAGVLEGDGGLVGERLEELDRRLAEDAAEAVGDGDGADRTVLDEQGHGQHRAVVGALELLAGALAVDDARIGQHVGRRDRRLLLHGEPARPVAARQHEDPVECAVGRHRAGDHHEVVGLRLEVVDAGRSDVEQIAHVFGDPLRHRLDLEGLREQPQEVGQSLGRAAARLAAREQPRVPDRHRRLGHQAVQQLGIVVVEIERCGPGEREHAQDLVLEEDRHGVRAVQVAGAKPLALPDRRVGRVDVGHVQRLAVERHPADSVLAERDRLGIEAAAEAIVGEGAHRHRAGLRVGHPHRHRRHRHDLAGRPGDRGERLVVVERRGDALIEPGQQTKTLDPRLGITHQR